MQPETYDKNRRLFMQWEETGWELNNVLHARDDSGATHTIHKHGQQSDWRVTNGTFSTGRTWYTVDGKDGVEYDDLDTALAVAFNRLRVIQNMGSSHNAHVYVQKGADISPCPRVGASEFVYRCNRHVIYGVAETKGAYYVLDTSLKDEPQADA